MNDLKQPRHVEFKSPFSNKKEPGLSLCWHAKVRITSITRLETSEVQDKGCVFAFTGVDTDGTPWNGMYNVRTQSGQMQTVIRINEVPQ